MFFFNIGLQAKNNRARFLSPEEVLSLSSRPRLPGSWCWYKRTCPRAEGFLKAEKHLRGRTRTCPERATCPQNSQSYVVTANCGTVPLASLVPERTGGVKHHLQNRRNPERSFSLLNRTSHGVRRLSHESTWSALVRAPVITDSSNDSSRDLRMASKLF